MSSSLSVMCHFVGTVDFSDRYAIFTRLNIRVLHDALNETEWNKILDGDVDNQTQVLTSHLVTLQSVFVTHEDCKARPKDQP